MFLVERMIWLHIEILSSLNSTESLIRSGKLCQTIFIGTKQTSGKLKKLQCSDSEYETTYLSHANVLHSKSYTQHTYMSTFSIFNINKRVILKVDYSLLDNRVPICVFPAEKTLVVILTLDHSQSSTQSSTQHKSF